MMDSFFFPFLLLKNHVEKQNNTRSDFLHLQVEPKHLMACLRGMTGGI